MLKLTAKLKEEIIDLNRKIMEEIQREGGYVPFSQHVEINEVVSEFSNLYPKIKFVHEYGGDIKSCCASIERKRIIMRDSCVISFYKAAKKYFPKISLKDVTRAIILHEIGHIETIKGDFESKHRKITEEIESYFVDDKRDVVIPERLFASWLQHQYNQEAEAWKYAITVEDRGVCQLLSSICLHDYKESFKVDFNCGDKYYSGTRLLIKGTN